jgi:hypothetical protein
MSKDIYAHFPPYGTTLDGDKKELNGGVFAEQKPMHKEIRLLKQEVEVNKIYIKGGWYTAKELMKFYVTLTPNGDPRD